MTDHLPIESTVVDKLPSLKCENVVSFSPYHSYEKDKE